MTANQDHTIIEIQICDSNADIQNSNVENNTNNIQNTTDSTGTGDEPIMVKTPVHTTYHTFSPTSSVAYSAHTKTFYFIAPIDHDLSLHLTLSGNTIQEGGSSRSSLYYMLSWTSFSTVSLGASPINSNSRDLDGWSKEEELNGDDESNDNHNCRCCCLFS
jgi:hypothetical protein